MTDPADCWGRYAGAISLAFDDGRKTQLTHAVPMLNERSLRGSFYISAPVDGDDWREKIPPWQEVARAGHEIGNHTLSHRCSGNLAFRRGRWLEQMTLEEVEADILAAQERLREVAPGQEQWTFAYPCSQTFVGRGAGQRSYVPIAAKHFLAARSGGEFGFANNPAVVDIHNLHSIDVSRSSEFEMIGLVEALAGRGQWLILCFHEINGRRLSVTSYGFGLLLDHLRRRREEIWTAPVVEVARKVLRFQAEQGGD